MDHTIKVWCIDTGDCVRTLYGHDGGYDRREQGRGTEDRSIRRSLASNRVISLYFDDKRLVSGSVDCTIKVWDIRNGECITLLFGRSPS